MGNFGVVLSLWHSWLNHSDALEECLWCTWMIEVMSQRECHVFLGDNVLFNKSVKSFNNNPYQVMKELLETGITRYGLYLRDQLLSDVQDILWFIVMLIIVIKNDFQIKIK